MSYVTKEMSARAREISVLNHIKQYETNLFKCVGSGYRSREHPSLAVSELGFFWHSKGKEYSGVTALDYLMKIRDYDFVSAVCYLIGERPLEKGEGFKVIDNIKTSVTVTTSKAIQTHLSEQKPLLLPRRNKDNFTVIAYLTNRGIDKAFIKDCINRGVLYESAIRQNAVFLGKDEKGKTQFATIRGTIGDFKCDAEGSNKSYGFIIPPENTKSTTVIICESPIDCLSYKTLCKRGDLESIDGWVLSLGGTSINALTHFLEQHQEISHCIIATDNDTAGNVAAENIAIAIQEISVQRKTVLISQRSPPLFDCKDLNSALMRILETERLKNKKLERERCI